MGRRTLAMYWWCCQCASGPWNVSIYSHCVDCQHARKWTCCKPDKLGANFDLIPTLQASSTASTSQSEDVLSNEPRSVPQSPASRAGKLQDLKIQINGVTTLAVPDTGAHVNALPLSTISLLGEHIDRYHDQTASVCTGKTTILASAFYVRVRYFVRRMPKRKARKCRVIFYVFEQFASGVSAILGQEFLKSHGILTKYAGLLSDRMPLEEAFDIPRCLSINSFTNGTLHYRIFKVFLNENPVHATPDTGSEVNLITLAFASLYSDFGEFRFEPTNPSNPPRIQFVDGAIYEVHFAVKLRVAADRKLLATQTTMVRYDSEKPIVEGPSQPREGECFQKGWVQEFFVVEGLAHDVILGQHTLYAMDAFNSYNHLFESSSDGSAPEMDVIRKCDKTPAKPDDVSSLKYEEGGHLSDLATQKRQLSEDLRNKEKGGDTVGAASIRQRLEEVTGKEGKVKQEYRDKIEVLSTEQSHPLAAALQPKKERRSRFGEFREAMKINTLN